MGKNRTPVVEDRLSAGADTAEPADTRDAGDAAPDGEVPLDLPADNPRRGRR